MPTSESHDLQSWECQQALNRHIRFSGPVLMRPWRSIKGDHAAAKPILAIIVVALLITSTVGAYAILFANPTKGVGAGDMVKVDYIGEFADGRVFDTSIYSVANDSEVPKSLFFQMRGNETRYNPIEFKIGGYTMIPGFDQGVRGMKVGETKTFDVPAAQAYGDMDPALKRTMQLEETLAVKQTLDKAAFKEMFGVEPATQGVNWAKHAGLSIDATYHIESNRFIVEFRATVGETHRIHSSGNAQGWDAEVTSIEGGAITVRHHLTEDDSFTVRGYDKAGLSYTNPQTRRTEVKNDFYIDEVDAEAGTFVMNYNPETKGRVLTFTVTLVSVA